MSAAPESMSPDTLPVGWVTKPLGELVTKLSDGSHNPPKKQDSGLMMLSARNIENNEIVFDKYRYISEDDFEKEHKRTRVTPGDVLLTIVGTIGRAAIVPDGLDDFTLQRSVAVLTPEGVLPKYLMYQLQAPFVQRFFEENARGTAQKGVYLKTLATTPIRVAPPEDQERIVAEIEKQFSRLDEVVASLKRVKANLMRYKAAVLKAAVEGKLTEEWRKRNPDVEPASKLLERILVERRAKWEEVELAKMKARGKEPKNDKWKEKFELSPQVEYMGLPALPDGWSYTRMSCLVEEPKYGTSKKCRYEAEGIGVLRIPNIVNGTIDQEDIKFSEFDAVEIETYRLEEGDLLVIRSNGSLDLVGRSAFITKSECQYLYAGYLIRLRPIKATVSGRYLEAAMSSAVVRAQIESMAKSTSGVNNINAKELKSLIVPICSLKEQQVLERDLESNFSIFDHLLNETKNLSSRADKLRQSILAQKFSGLAEVNE